jgi:hypothetical protein
VHDLAQVHDEMHHSVDRMFRIAGLTDEDLGFRYSPRKNLADDERLAANTRSAEPASTGTDSSIADSEPAAAVRARSA